ncbi:ribosomal 5S rRNA E-loop binding protein Ctc/L25/TL5 [Desulfofarcimen acetoxidans DSM 771]|uniref:Large ribosomal subunit protein bL25 n=1 Tax=Desulfofarcimen acetoxidans (strain ATCC 49208 / DSM 771 / KCTC 5769 / VKM B-1644 / 5575) TaxID=485916 RepID=C8W305_DESAS|nr:50S ribosomal protein L25 [Desulfofarcimen acetoxidans]ACV61161.1 ribosomal 5S rRNA E-loop binding protein Ctc/L25/TL5 [Desulfofarcimen acetoxidans DSM 771]
MAEDLQTTGASLDAYPREGCGKGYSNKLFSKGYMPAVLYSKSIGSKPLELEARALEDVLKSKTGRNSVIDLHLKSGDGEDSYKVMVKDLQYHPIRRSYLHADFLEISLTDRVQIAAKVVLVGEAPGVAEEGGILDQIIREVGVKCLPGSIPDIITVDVSKLYIGDSVAVMDLQAGPDIEILADEDLVVARVIPPQSLQEEPGIETEAGEGEKTGIKTEE